MVSGNGSNGGATETLSELKARLAPFTASNPASKLDEIGEPIGGPVVVSLWGDESILFILPHDADALIEALNNIYLPERFTAIWHKDTELFEIIYTAYPFFPNMSDLLARAFVFRHKGRDYECKYGESSNRLLLIAEHFIPGSGPPVTYFRNLGSFRNYVLSQKGTEGFVKLRDAKPISFWIKGITWDEDTVLDLVRHVNFYMTYYDTVTPQIMIHSPKSESVGEQPKIRFPFGSFPKQILSRELDDALLQFWAASLMGDPIRRFLYNYQILEYAAFFFIEEHIKREIRKRLAAPHATENLDGLTQQIIEALGESKIPEPQKLESLLRTCVNPRLIWRELEPNLTLFSVAGVFDGGFILQPITRPDWTVDDFATAWLPAFSNAIRSIRNALSHGKEQRMASVITPTAANLQRLQPWISPIAVAAREVIVYRNLA